MPEYAEWYLILANLQTHLAAQIPTAAVGQGFSRGEIVPVIVPAIRLYRRGEPDLDIWTRAPHGGKGRLEIVAEVWVKNEDPDPAEANADLAAMELTFRQALLKWPIPASAALGLKITDMAFVSVAGEGENYRPNVAAFYGIAISWAK